MKNVLKSQVVLEYAALGGPQVDVSRVDVDVAVWMLVGTSGRYTNTKRVRWSPDSKKYPWVRKDSRSRTIY